MVINGFGGVVSGLGNVWEGGTELFRQAEGPAEAAPERPSLEKADRQSRSLSPEEINHAFDRHGHEVLNVPKHSLSRKDHLDRFTGVIDRARKSNLTFRSRSGGDATIAHLARVDGAYVVVHFFAEGPKAGSLASAWRPRGSQLGQYLDAASRQGP
jgi:hypothetical protein